MKRPAPLDVVAQTRPHTKVHAVYAANRGGQPWSILASACTRICILTAEGELIEKRICTERKRFEAVLGSRPRARILIEASTESEWVARCLEGLGHETIVADPNYAPMYGQRVGRPMRGATCAGG